MIFLIISIPVFTFIASTFSLLNLEQVTLVTATLTIMTGIYTYKNEKRKELEARLHEKKAEAYSTFFQIVSMLIDDTGANRKTSEKHLDSKIRELRNGLLLWGSMESLRGYKSLTQMGESDDPYASFKVVESMYRLLRKDLGHEDNYEDDYDIVSIFLNSKGMNDLKKMQSEEAL